MKNLFVLPTDKSSRLFIYDGKLGLANGFQYGSDAIQNQNTCITSDEEIKEGDWILKCKNVNDWNFKSGELQEKDYSYFKIKCISLALLNPEDKKIILTTDQELIKDGVQAIDDEFLEWFVKNPSCEWVEFEESNLLNTSRTYLGVDKYKIIIPKEEPNPFELPKALPDDVFYQSLKPKQETLEEVAEKLKSKELFKESNDRARKNLSEIKSLPIQERIYSEDEVIKLLEKRDKYLGNWLPPVKWLEQNKNK